MIAAIVYVLCAGTAFACAALLARGYSKTRSALLFWSAICFAGLTLANVLLVVDLLIVPDIDLSVLKNLTTLISLLLLVYSLIWETTL